MLFQITLLRDKGKRLESREPSHTDAIVKSEQRGNFLSLSVASFHGGPSAKVSPLFEAKLMKMDSEEIVFLGFEQVDGRAYVQEWKLKPSPTSSNWLTYEMASAPRNAACV